MIRSDIIVAAWRLNRTIPFLIAGLLILNVTLFLFLTLVSHPREESSRQALVKLQERVRRGSSGASDPESNFRQGHVDLEKFRSSIPPRQEFSDLLSDFYAIAVKAGLSVDQINYNPKELPQERLLSYSLSFGVTGRYDQIKRFIHDLEQSPRLIVIDKIALSAARSQDLGRQVTLALAMTTYFTSEGGQ
jgi:type IV pilus assembly protein PilO